jgi:hypothetical protein
MKRFLSNPPKGNREEYTFGRVRQHTRLWVKHPVLETRNRRIALFQYQSLHKLIENGVKNYGTRSITLSCYVLFDRAEQMIINFLLLNGFDRRLYHVVVHRLGRGFEGGEPPRFPLSFLACHGGPPKGSSDRRLACGRYSRACWAREGALTDIPGDRDPQEATLVDFYSSSQSPRPVAIITPISGNVMKSLYGSARKKFQTPFSHRHFFTNTCPHSLRARSSGGRRTDSRIRTAQVGITLRLAGG